MKIPMQERALQLLFLSATSFAVLTMASGCNERGVYLEKASHNFTASKAPAEDLPAEPPVERELVPAIPPPKTVTSPKPLEIIEVVPLKLSVRGREIELKAILKSKTGKEEILLQGQVDENFVARLLDVSPSQQKLHRLVANAVCIDDDCASVFVDIFYKVNGKTVKTQFVQKSKPKEKPAPKKDAPQPKTDELENQGDDHESNPAAEGNPDDPFYGQEGEFVGLPPEERKKLDDMLEDLNPEPPVTLPALPNDLEPLPEPPKAMEPLPEPPKPNPSTGPRSPAPPTKEGVLLRQLDPIAQENLPNVPDAIPALPEPSKLPPKADGTSPSFGAAPSGPLTLNLTEGGKARGSYTEGSIRNSSELPLDGDGFTKLYTEKRQNFGSGLMVTLLQDIAVKFKALKPEYRDNTLCIGAVAKEGGGDIGHRSHENGLDADICYLDPNPEFKSQIARLKTDFDYQRNFDFWEMVIGTGMVSRIFVDGRIKTAFCQWAKTNNKLQSGKEVLRRLIPYAGHDNHFHLRLQCSPYYDRCRGQIDPPDTTGC